MCNFLNMAVFDSVKHLFEKISSISFTKTTFFDKFVEKLSSLAYTTSGDKYSVTT